MLMYYVRSKTKSVVHKTRILPVVLYGCEKSVSYIEEGTETGGVPEQGAEEQIWA
jgi:hypothetical protein